MSSKEYLENALKQDDDAIDEASLRQDGVVALRRRLFEDGVVLKKMSGVKLRGAHLLTLAQTYVASLNEGSTPTISTASTRVVEAQCEEAADKAVSQYEKEMAAGLAALVKAAGADYDVDTTPVE